MKKEIVQESIVFLLILLFIYTAVSKLIAFDTFRLQLEHQPLTKLYASLFSILIPTVELVIAIFLILPTLRKVGLQLSLILMTTFTLYVGYMLYVWPHNKLPCSCGGIIKQMSWTQHLAFNILFTLFALLGVILTKTRRFDAKVDKALYA